MSSAAAASLPAWAAVGVSLPAVGGFQCVGSLLPPALPAHLPARRIVTAGCLGESECIVRSSIDVFEDACPGTPKTLSFGYK